ncbi:hypothetical protein ACOSQ4_031516 [Xanthoceras sorbifolium]
MVMMCTFSFVGLQPFALKIRCFCHYALISESNEMMSLKGHGQEPEFSLDEIIKVKSHIKRGFKFGSWNSQENRLEEGRRGYNRSRHRVSRRDDAAQVQVAKKARNDEKRRGGGHYQTFSQLTDSQYHNTG